MYRFFVGFVFMPIRINVQFNTNNLNNYFVIIRVTFSGDYTNAEARVKEIYLIHAYRLLVLVQGKYSSI